MSPTASLYESMAEFKSNVAPAICSSLCKIDFSPYLMLGLWGANGAFYALAAMSFGVIMQTRCPVETIGTVSASARSAQLFVMVLGPLIGASVANATSLELVFVLSGIVALAWATQLAVSSGSLPLKTL